MKKMFKEAHHENRITNPNVFAHRFKFMRF